ncbi:MAG: hypothetical protein IKD77_04925 [Bacilli bacterium]|nr:hypothetical protein [Bacilli bacterium]
MAYTNYGYYTPEGQYDLIDLYEILMKQINSNYEYNNCTTDEIQRLLPYLAFKTKEYLKSKKIEYIEINESRRKILVEKAIGQENIEKLLGEPEFYGGLIKCVSNYIKSKYKTLEDYGLSEEAIIVLTSKGYRRPTEIYNNPERLLNRLEEMCFHKQYLMREIIQQLNLESILEEDLKENKWKFTNIKPIPARDPNGSTIIRDGTNETFIGIKVPGKIKLDDQGRPSVSCLFAVDAKGNIQSYKEFQGTRDRLVAERREELRGTEKIISSLNEQAEKITNSIKSFVEVMYGLSLFEIFMCIFTIFFAANINIAAVAAIVVKMSMFFIPINICVPAIWLFYMHKLEYYFKLPEIKEKIEEQEGIINSMSYVANINTKAIADKVEEMFENGMLNIDKRNEIAGVLEPEIGRMILEGHGEEATKLLAPPKEMKLLNGSSEISILSAEETWGIKGIGQLEALKKYGTMTPVTDFAILGGMMTYDNITVPDDHTLKGRAGLTYTKTPNGKGYVICISAKGEKGEAPRVIKPAGAAIRPVLRSPEIFEKVYPNRVSGYNGVEEVEYGEYPQYVPNVRTQELLNERFIKKSLIKTGRKYTIWKTYARIAEPIELEEYESDNKRYVQVLRCDCAKSFPWLSDRNYHKPGENYFIWIEVSPVVWLIDSKTQTLISKRGLISGIDFSDNSYEGVFARTKLKKYLDEYLLPEITQTRIPIIKKDEPIEEIATSPQASTGARTTTYDKALEEILRLISGETKTNTEEKIKRLYIH